MLFRKMLREMRQDFGQFLSIFILAFLALSMFTIMKSSNIGAYKEQEVFHGETNLADGWLYGEGFSSDNLENVRELDHVKDAQLRMQITASSVEQNGAQVEVLLEDENIVSKPYIMEGSEFDPENQDSVWLSERFANEWNLSVGDDFSYTYHGVTVTKNIAGLIASPEYEYMCADKDLETDYSDIAYVYMSYDAFPAKEYVEHIIKSGDLTVQDVLENSNALDTLTEKLEANGMTADDITRDMMLDYIEGLNDEKIKSMMPYTQMLITTDQADALSMEQDIADAVDDNYAVFVDQSSIPGLKVFADELNQHDQFSYAFTIVFVLIAILVIMTTMSRMVERQRTQIGTMNAMGMKHHKVVLHYMGYSFIISLAGSIAGIFVGTYWWGQALTDLFATFYTLPAWRAQFDASFCIVALIVVAICTASSYFSCRKLLRVKSAECLKTAPPKAGKRCVFEHLPFWKRLGFTSQYNLRDISRAKLRAFMGVFGTACGMMILTCGIACNTTLDNVYDWSFGKLQHYDYDCQFSKDITVEEADTYASKYNGELVMADSIEVAAKEHAVSEEKKTTGLIVTEGKGLYGLTDVNQNVVSIPAGTIAISSKLAKSLNVVVGDVVYWHIYTENEWYQATIGLISRNPSTSGITMLRSDFEKTGEAYKPTILYTDENITGIDQNTALITTVHSNEDILSAFQDSMSVMYVLVAVFVIFAIVLILVVLYNSGNLSFHERIQEFATLKVLGFKSNQIRFLLTIQNLWLSVIGILLGAPFAKLILQYMFDSNGDSYDYEAVISFSDYLVGGVCVLAVSVCVSFFFSKRIKKLDMVEVLKGME